MASTGQNFSMYQGETRVVTVTIPSGVTVSSTDAIKWVMATAAGVALVTKTQAGGGIGNRTSTTFDIYLYPADTVNVVNGEHIHEARVTNADGDECVVTVGTVSLSKSITK